MVEKDKVKKALEKAKKQRPQEPKREEPKKQRPQEIKNREIHPLDSNVIFREELLVQLGRIANALEVLATKDEKSV